MRGGRRTLGNRTKYINFPVKSGTCGENRLLRRVGISSIGKGASAATRMAGRWRAGAAFVSARETNGLSIAAPSAYAITNRLGHAIDRPKPSASGSNGRVCAAGASSHMLPGNRAKISANYRRHLPKEPSRSERLLSRMEIRYLLELMVERAQPKLRLH